MQGAPQVFFRCTVSGGSRAIGLTLTPGGQVRLTAPNLVASSDLAGLYVQDESGGVAPFSRTIGLAPDGTALRYEVWTAGHGDGSGEPGGGYRAFAGEGIYEDLPCDPGSLKEDLIELEALVDIAQISP